MIKHSLALTVVIAVGLCCIDVGQMGLFANKYGEVDSYDFSDSLAALPANAWRYVPKENTGSTDALYIKSPDSSSFRDKLVIFFYGSGYNLYYSSQVGKLFREIGLNFFSADYYGFGRTASSITPSEELCYQGAAETIRYAIDSLGFSSKNIILCGFSLGTGVAVEMATRDTCAAVLLFAPFLNIDAEVKTVSGGYDIPGDWFSNAKFDNGSKIGNIHAPLCMFVGENDCLVDPRNIQELYQRAIDPKFEYVLSGEDHPDLPSDSFYKWKDHVILFLNTYLNN
jgi:acetyl esterase/lipase